MVANTLTKNVNNKLFYQQTTSTEEEEYVPPKPESNIVEEKDAFYSKKLVNDLCNNSNSRLWVKIIKFEQYNDAG